MNIQAPYKDIPVVYCILNQNDPAHYLRLEKSFAGEMNAYDMASEIDSIYYPEASVYMERWRDGEYKDDINFQEIDTIPRDQGIFASEINRVYASTDNLDGSSEYRLRIVVPGKEDTIKARTKLVNNIRITKPPYTLPALPISRYENDTRVEWYSTPNARVYFLQLRFNYLEVVLNDTVPKSAVWRIAHYVSKHNKGNELMKADVSNEKFYKWLPSKLAPANGVKRIAHKKAIDVIFTIGGEELYTYMQIYNPDQGINQEKPVYTNISGGIGLFSARYEQELKGKAISFPSIDSLAYGIYTKDLGFVDSTDDYYHK
jgi:hypothetical protein